MGRVNPMLLSGDVVATNADGYAVTPVGCRAMRRQDAMLNREDKGARLGEAVSDSRCAHEAHIIRFTCRKS